MALLISEGRDTVAALASDGRLRAFGAAGGIVAVEPTLAASPDHGGAAALARLNAGPGSYFTAATETAASSSRR